MPDIEWVEVAGSSDVDAIAYDAESETIFVRFLDNGAEYGYSPATAALWDDFRYSGSKGSFVYRVLKRLCQATRIN